MSLKNKNVLITGGGTGLGAVMAHDFAGLGASVIVAGRTQANLQKVAETHERITPYKVDVADEAAVVEMMAQIEVPDIVIANAGASVSMPMLKTDLATWQQMIDVNLTGVFLSFREALKKMQDKKWGRLIAIASTAGLKGYPYVSAYGAAKHGVVGMVKSLALELAPGDVTVNALCPGFLDTEMTDRSIANIMEKTGISEAEALAVLENTNPQRRLIKPEEVSAAAIWLCGDHAQAMTGQAIPVAGGEL